MPGHVTTPLFAPDRLDHRPSAAPGLDLASALQPCGTTGGEYRPVNQSILTTYARFSSFFLLLEACVNIIVLSSVASSVHTLISSGEPR